MVKNFKSSFFLGIIYMGDNMDFKKGQLFNIDLDDKDVAA